MKDSLHNLCNKKLPNKVTHSFLPQKKRTGIISAPIFCFLCCLKNIALAMIDIHVICTTEPHVIKDCTLSWNNILLAEIPRYVNNQPKSHRLMNDRPSQERPLTCVSCTEMIRKTNKQRTTNNPKPYDQILQIKYKLYCSDRFVKPILPSPCIPSKQQH